MNALQLATRGFLRGTTTSLTTIPVDGRVSLNSPVVNFDGRVFPPKRLTQKEALEKLPFWVNAYAARRVDVRSSDVAPTRDALTLIYTGPGPRTILELTREDYETFLVFFTQDPYRSAFRTLGRLPSQDPLQLWIQNSIRQLFTL